MDMESTNGPMAVSIRATGTRTRFLATESITGMMAEPIRDTGSTIICMDKEFTNGLMDVNMKENMLTTRNMVMEFILTPMVDLTKDNGLTENSTVRVSSLLLRELRGKESGMKARESSGSTMRKNNNSPTTNICKIKTTIIEHTLLIRAQKIFHLFGVLGFWGVELI